MVSASDVADVLVLTARFGSGHRQVSLAVQQALLSLQPNLRVSTADYADILNPAFYHGVLAAYTFSLKHWWAGFDWFYRTTARFAPGSPAHRLLHGFGQRRMRALLAATRPRAVVCTFPEEAGVLSELRRYRRWSGFTCVVITDYVAHSQWIHPNTDLYCVPSAEVAGALIARGVPPARVAVTGIPLRAAFALRHDRERVRRELGVDGRSAMVLVMPGALGDLSQPSLAARVLLKLDPPPHVVLVTGTRELAARAARELAVAGVQQGRLHLLGAVDDMAALMQAADLLVGKAGGVSTAEALASGLPMVLFRPLPGQERVNAAFLSTQGAARIAADAPALAAVVRSILGRPQVAAEMREACARMARPVSAAAVAELVLSRLVEGVPGAVG